MHHAVTGSRLWRPAKSLSGGGGRRGPRRTRSKKHFMRRIEIEGRGEPCHLYNRRQSGRGYGLQQRQWSNMTQPATMLRRMLVRMLRRDRGRLRTKYGAEEQHYYNCPPDAAAQEHSRLLLHAVPLLRWKS